MKRRRGSRQQSIPQKHLLPALRTPDLLVLDRFTERNLEEWDAASADLDELYNRLYFDLEPERLRRQEDIKAALRSKPAEPLELRDWFRIVPLKYTLEPLSCAGGLKGIGGRFTVGNDVEHRMGEPFPGLYLASDAETTYREAFQCRKGTTINGLTPEELSLAGSYAHVRLNGRVENVFDVTDLDALAPVCEILADFALPKHVPEILARLGEKPTSVIMVRNAAQLRHTLTLNWTGWPSNFGIPSPSQQFGALLRSAGYEGILYASTKGAGQCLCVLPENIASDETFIELSDSYPSELKHPRLDIDSSDDLAGWHVIRPKDRPRQ